jgi:hypothetical protein
MINSTCRNAVGALLCIAFTAGQTACFAGEQTTSSVESTTPSGSRSQTYHSQADQNGAKVSATKNSVQGNADGSVTSSRQHESHSLDATGAAHHKSAGSTTVNPDGSTNSVKQESTSTNP